VWAHQPALSGHPARSPAPACRDIIYFGFIFSGSLSVIPAGGNPMRGLAAHLRISTLCAPDSVRPPFEYLPGGVRSKARAARHLAQTSEKTVPFRWISVGGRAGAGAVWDPAGNAPPGPCVGLPASYGRYPPEDMAHSFRGTPLPTSFSERSRRSRPGLSR
jgi:hypothetical protein